MVKQCLVCGTWFKGQNRHTKYCCRASFFRARSRREDEFYAKGKSVSPRLVICSSGAGIRPEGPATRPAKGAALDDSSPQLSFGPKGQQFASPWAFNAMTGWAFGPEFA